MTAALLARFAQSLIGRRCIAEHREHDWSFNFGRGTVITVAAAWRLLTLEGVAFADRDLAEGRPMPWPLGGETAPERLLKRRKVEAVDIDAVTGDLRIQFEGDIRLEVFNNSATYDGWQADFAIDRQAVCLVGAPGGGVAFVGVAAASHEVGTLLDT